MIKLALSEFYCCGVSHEKHRLDDFSSLRPTPPPPPPKKFYFCCCLAVSELWRQLVRVTGRKSEFLRASGNSMDFPEFAQTSPEVPADFPTSSPQTSSELLTVDLNSNPEVPQRFFRTSSPESPWTSPEVAGPPAPQSQHLSLRSLTRSDDSQGLLWLALS